MRSTTPIYLLLVHRQALIRTALRKLIETWPEIGRVAEAADIAEACAALAHEQPDIILLDLDGYADFDAGAIPLFLSGAGQARILLLNSEHNAPVHRQALRKGAVGVVMKEKPPEFLHKAIQRIQAGDVWRDRTTVAHVLNDLAVVAPLLSAADANRIGLLTNRERQVIALIGEGLKNKQIAGRMSISEPTVRHHLTAIFEKLGVKNRLELVIFAHRYNLAMPIDAERAVG